MRQSLQRDTVPIDFPVQSSTEEESYLTGYPSLSECLNRLSSLSNAVLEDERGNSSPLKRLAREVQELMQLLSIHQSFLAGQPSTEQQTKIHYMAFYDGLTGIANRQFFEMHLKQLIKSTNSESIFYLIFLDLDGFKEINDTYGHEVGDILLKNVAKRLRHNLRRDDVVARFGGDEFTILLNFHEKQNLDLILRRMISFISQPYNINSLNLNINVSLGVSKYPASGESYENLIKKADMAMYMSKSKGNNLYTLSF
ncbi:GGDEF domain-containing protein [Candidatus Paracaedibacter symbiosus]|uniref:GGDEF domain-containing protein n=1 Tax=Candidatus Paracaedibacter symbiosus TaxID=244582 RepID=UPI00068DEB7F|nr:GGDEF domain-containing protein [Candidatus Paracaedibacter symbiosus]